jgi:hypothetical protein
MRVAKYIHSCLLLEKGSSKILFDPGKFSFVEGIVKPEEFTNLAAVIITHAHPDHLQVEAVGQILKNNPGAVIFTNEEVRSEVKKQNIEVTVFESGSRIIGEFHVKALSAPHAAILDSDPPQNTAYVIDDTLLNPGDSFADSLLEYKISQFWRSRWVLPGATNSKSRRSPNEWLRRPLFRSTTDTQKTFLSGKDTTIGRSTFRRRTLSSTRWLSRGQL